MSKIGRKRAIENISNYPRDKFACTTCNESLEEIYGQNVFSLREMRRRLPKSIYQSIIRTIEGEQPLDPQVADTVANAMKEWAMEKGATHYAHVFFPLTGLTAEKHDSFYEPTGDGQTMARFSGQALVQGEPDASSFPNGGLRETFEARGYTAWDVSSPAYIFRNPNGATLCIPTAFISWTGEALDKKTPLLRSMQAINTQATRLLKLFGHEQVGRVSATAGAEQEYFLIDRQFYYQRPDLLNCGRTLFGSAPPKGQEFDDHYFGSIMDRVAAYMFEVEHELFKLGIPAKTRHNEVAPGQYEIAPVFETANVATDHQQLVMVTLRRVAEKHGMICLMHEKPFQGVNGSGKHVNYSLGNATQGNLLDPGDTAEENAQFLAFCAAILRGVHKNSTLLRAVIASAGNDHRLGANEAPPAIISVFLGDRFTEIFDAIARGESGSAKEKDVLQIGVDLLPDLPKDVGDRNRTSPFAFIGNRFEFRAVGSSASIAGPLVAMNTIFADSLSWICDRIEAANPTNREEFNRTIQQIIGEIWTEHKNIVFNGDGYSAAWHRQAVEERQLPNLANSAASLPELMREEYVELFERFHVLSRRELESRLEIYLEQFCMQLNVEANLTIEIARTQILPAAVKYLGQVAAAAEEVKDLGLEPEMSLVTELNDGVKGLKRAIDALVQIRAEIPRDDSHAAANYMNDTLFPAMQAVRAAADGLEEIVDDQLWPLPTYQEMLFIK